MRQFTASFFTNAGVPAGLLNIKRTVQESERQLIRQKFPSQHGGPGGWHSLLVIDGEEVEYTPMGLPLGERGIACPALDEISESRILMCFGVPPSLVASRLGMSSSSYANRKSDRELFTEMTVMPMLAEFASTLSMELADEFPDVDRIDFDYARMRVLSEDQDALHARVRDDLKAGVIGRRQAARLLGYPEPEPSDVYLVPSALIPTPVTEIAAAALPEAQERETEAAEADDTKGEGMVATGGRRNGRD
jgi:phage portal protein BeeE